MKRKLAFFLAIMMAAMLLAACAQDEKAPVKDTLILGTIMDVNSFAPVERASAGDTLLHRAIYMHLFYIDYPSRELKSEACSDMVISDDATTITFTIKDNITFHNGEKLTVEDVVYSIEACKITPSLMTWSMNIDTVTALDDKTVQLKLLTPGADFMYVGEIPLMHKATTEAAGESFRDAPVGCGPYKLVKHEPGYQVTLEAFDDYVMGKPYFNTLIYRVISDPTAALMALEAGDIDAMQVTTYSDLDDIMSNEKLSVHTVSYGLDALVFNNRTAPYDDANVRLALNYAIDKERCSEVMYETLPSVATSHISVIKDDRLTGYPHDLEKAKEYLALAGFPGGEGFPDVVIETVDSYKVYAQVIQNNFQELGLNASVQISEANAFVGRLMTGDVPVGFISFGLGFQPSQYTSTLMTDGPFNFSGYGSAEVDQLFAAAAQEIDDAKRHDLYVEACLLLEKDAPYGLIGYQQILFVYNSNLVVDQWCETFLLPQYTRMK